MDYMLNNKRRVVCLVMQWAAVHGERLQEEAASVAFLEVVRCSHHQFERRRWPVKMTFPSLCLVFKEFLVAVSHDAKVIPALRDQLAKLEAVVKRK